MLCASFNAMSIHIPKKNIKLILHVIWNKVYITRCSKSDYIFIVLTLDQFFAIPNFVNCKKL